MNDSNRPVPDRVNSEDKKNKKPGLNIWWPDVSNFANASAVARYGLWPALYIAFANGMTVVLEYFNVETAVTDVNPGIFWDIVGAVIVVSLALLLALLAYNRSRVASILILMLATFELYFFVTVFIPADPSSGGWVLLRVIVTAAALSGVRGAFAYHRFKTIEQERQEPFL